MVSAAADFTTKQPAAGLAPDGTLHVVFSNEFSSRYNIFYVAWNNGVWTLPRLVSKTLNYPFSHVGSEPGGRRPCRLGRHVARLFGYLSRLAGEHMAERAVEQRPTGDAPGDDGGRRIK